MSLVIFSIGHPEGVASSWEAVHHVIAEAVKAKGVYRGSCPCCNRPIVVRSDDNGTASMTAGDEHFLLHDGGTS